MAVTGLIHAFNASLRYIWSSSREYETMLPRQQITECSVGDMEVGGTGAKTVSPRATQLTTSAFRYAPPVVVP
jgi:hypothetical protein